MFRRRLDQTASGLLCVAKDVQRACLILTQNTRVFHGGSGAGLHPWTIQLSQLRIGLAMTDQELLPTARNITDKLERKADRNRRGIDDQAGTRAWMATTTEEG